jgi:hypothetical protein
MQWLQALVLLTLLKLLLALPPVLPLTLRKRQLLQSHKHSEFCS